MRLAIVGSRDYQSERKIREFIYKAKQKFGDALIIASGGCREGADYYARKFTLEQDIRYIEFNPAHTPYNEYSYMKPEYYGKPYHVSQFHHRNMILAGYCDRAAIFISGDVPTKGSRSFLRYITKANKPYVIIN